MPSIAPAATTSASSFAPPARNLRWKLRSLRRCGKSGVATRNEARSASNWTDPEFTAASTATDGADHAECVAGYSPPYRRRLDRHAVGARHQVKLEFDQFRRAVIKSPGADAGHAAAQAALQRTNRLPFQPVDRIAGRLSLRDRRSCKMLVPIVVVAIRASQIDLALPLHEQLTSFGDERFELRVGAGDDRDAARLLRDEGCGREQLVAFVCKRRRPVSAPSA